MSPPAQPTARAGTIAGGGAELGLLAAEERLRAAEACFAEGRLDDARRALLDLLDAPLGDSLAADVHSDLAVVSVSAGDLAAARLHALQALARRPTHAAASETLGRLSEQEGDLVQAAHWFARALQHDPHEPTLAVALAGVQQARGRWQAAARALLRAGELGALDEPGRAQLAAMKRRMAPGAVPIAELSGRRGRLLICVDFFHPSVGGSERLAEQVAVELRSLGWDVEIATRALDRRRDSEHRGLKIHEIAARPVDELAAILAGGGFDAVLAFSDPRAWPVPAVCAQPAGRIRRVVVPCINPDNLSHLTASEATLAGYARLMERADAVVHSSLAGLDAQLADGLGIASTYVPNGAERLRGDRSFRRTAPIPADAPLALVVGNFWPEKNQAELLESLAGRLGDWQLALVGAPAPGQERLAAHIAELAGADDSVHLIGPLEPSAVAAAMAEADLLLLPSRAEATPLVIVEAMSQELPWIATPASGAAHDHAGGLILPVRDMAAGMRFLHAQPQMARALGAAGRAHWEACYRWEHVAGRYDQLLRGAGALPESPPPATAMQTTDTVRAAQFDAMPAAAFRDIASAHAGGAK